VLPLTLDVTNRKAVFAAVDRAHEHFGKLDVIVNNAGYGLFGMIEEIREEEARSQLETNLFGALWVTQAALPILRGQGHGHIVQVSTMGGILAFPYLGLYHASKWALEGFTEALAQEVATFGINVTLIEPGGYDTDWAGISAVHSRPVPAYDGVRAGVREFMDGYPLGDPKATAEALFAVVDADKPPLRVLFGGPPLQMVRDRYIERLAEWEEWEAVSKSAQGS
jgi:NAD(P)-dependent dehydrogenase (short-subunit alcohol dehydrogenase family)